MVMDCLVGVVIGAIGILLCQKKLAHNKVKLMGGFLNAPQKGEGMLFPQEFKGFSKTESGDFYELGKTNMENYCKVHEDVPYVMDREVKCILTDIECKGTENEIKYKLEILKKDIDVAVNCVSKRNDKFVIDVYKQLQNWITMESDAINQSLKTFKQLYIPYHTRVKDLIDRMDATDKDYILDLIKLGNRILENDMYRDGKAFKELVTNISEDNKSKKLKDYLINTFEPKYNEIVLKSYA